MAKHRIADDNTSQAVKPGNPCAGLGDGEGLDLLLFTMGGAHGWRFANSIGGQR